MPSYQAWPLAAALCLSGVTFPESSNAAELDIRPKNEQVIVRSHDGEFSPPVVRYKLINTGERSFRWAISRHPKWLTPNISEGRVGAQPVVVKFRPTKKVVGKLTAGIYEGVIQFTYTNKDRRIKRNFTLIVEGDLAIGQQVYDQKCRPCHDLDAHKIGPFMRGVYGSQAGTAEGFNYSDAMKAYGQIWEERNLDAFLADPKGLIPGNKMPIAGIVNPVERMNIIAYLKSLTP